LDDLDSRLTGLENRLDRLDAVHQSLCELSGSLARTESISKALLEHLGLPPVTEEEIDAAMAKELPNYLKPRLTKPSA
jgi:hypothetical protein